MISHQKEVEKALRAMPYCAERHPGKSDAARVDKAKAVVEMLQNLDSGSSASQ